MANISVNRPYFQRDIFAPDLAKCEINDIFSIVLIASLETTNFNANSYNFGIFRICRVYFFVVGIGLLSFLILYIIASFYVSLLIVSIKKLKNRFVNRSKYSNLAPEQNAIVYM